MPKVKCNDVECIYNDGAGCVAGEIIIETTPANLDGEIVVLCRCMMQESLEG